MKAVKTRVGFSGVGEHRFMGHSALADLAGSSSLAMTMGLAVTGRVWTVDEGRVFEDIVHVATAADGRVWPLKAGRLVSSYGGIAPGLATILLSVEGGNAIGPWVTATCAEGILRCSEFVDSGSGSCEDFILKHGRMHGWGVPLRKVDERTVRLAELVRERGRQDLKYWRLFEDLSKVFLQTKGIYPNLAGSAAAVLLDLGLSVREVATLSMLSMIPMFAAHAVESADMKYPEYQQLPNEAIEYKGSQARELPELWRSSPK